MGRHRDPRGRTRVLLIAGSGLAVAAVGALVVAQILPSHDAPAVAPAVAPAPSRPLVTPSTTTPSSSHSASSAPPPLTSTSTSGRAPSAAAHSVSAAAGSRLSALVAERSSSSTSVAAYDTVTGASVQAGATSGMTAASAAKLQLLESLLLQHQRRGTQLSSNELDTVTDMIEHSDNDAADTVFYDIGGRDAVVDLEDDLGLTTTGTVAGPGDLWGLTRTSAGQQLALLRNLVDRDSPLDAGRRAFALRLMRNVEEDQDWGVPVVASNGTRPAVKNGWLAVGSDDGRWAVNSLGVVTTGGHPVLIAVLTQHGPSYAAGITRVETLARAAAASLDG